MKGILYKREQGWVVKWSDFHSFAHGTEWQETVLQPEDQVLEDLEEGKQIEFDIEYDFDDSHLFIPRVVIKDLKISIDRGNHLIAEFMGDYFDSGLEPAYYIRKNKEYDIKECHYHDSWDWIMPVLIEIETRLDVVTSIQINRYKDVGMKEMFGETSVCLFEGNHDTIIIDDRLKINALWEGIVGFLMWYNSKKE